MDIKIFILFAFILIALESSVTIFNLNRRSSLNIVYSLCTFLFAVCCFLIYKVQSAPDYTTCRSWYVLCYPIAITVTTLLFHFSLLLTENKFVRHKFFFPIIYFPVVFFSYMMLFHGYFSASFVETIWGYAVVVDPFKSGNFIFIIYYELQVIVSAVLVIKWRFRVDNASERQIAKVITVPYLAGAFGILITPGFVYIQNSDNFNMILDILSLFLLVILIFGIRYAVKKYHFMHITQNTNLGVLIDGFKEPVVIIDPDSSIICRNPGADGLIGLSEAGRYSSFADIFGCGDQLGKLINEFEEGKKSSGEIKCRLASGKNNSEFNLYLQPITNNKNSVAGIFVSIRKELSGDELKTKFKLTDRQMHIVKMLMSGLTNKDISGNLNISERTVENHLVNIYNKLGVENKIALYNMAQRYNVGDKQ